MADHAVGQRTPRLRFPNNRNYVPLQQGNSNTEWKIAVFILLPAVTGLFFFVFLQWGQMTVLLERNEELMTIIREMKTDHATHTKKLERELEKQREDHAATMKQMRDIENKFETLMNEERLRNKELAKRNEKLTESLEGMREQFAKLEQKIDNLQKDNKALREECQRLKDSQGLSNTDLLKIGAVALGAGLLGTQIGGIALGGKVVLGVAGQIGSKSLSLVGAI